MGGVDAVAITMVLAAALLHAGWNAILKASDDRLLTQTFLVGTGTLIFLPIVPFLEPPPPECWPFIAGSVTIHAGYFVFLPLAYRHGDLGQVYPIARGTGPLVVAAASGIAAGEVLSPIEISGVILVSLGIIGVALSDGLPRGRGFQAVLFALITGTIIGAYTINDGVGVRLAGAQKLGYIAWIHILDPIPLLIFALVFRRKGIIGFARRQGVRSLLGGIMGTAAYGLVLWAMTLGRMAHVAALRETSVIFAAFLGALFLGERFGPRRVIAAVIVACGVVALHGGA